MESKSEILIYTNPEGLTQIDVRLENETLWLNQYQLADVFETERTSVLKHIQNIYETGELHKETTCAKLAHVKKEGNRKVNRQIFLDKNKLLYKKNGESLIDGNTLASVTLMIDES
jgi:hypothetical protein